jgi:hypothetical protein
MGILALIVGILASLCAIMGILYTIPVETMPAIGLDGSAWFSLAMILFLAAITCLLTRGASYE